MSVGSKVTAIGRPAVIEAVAGVLYLVRFEDTGWRQIVGFNELVVRNG